MTNELAQQISLAFERGTTRILTHEDHHEICVDDNSNGIEVFIRCRIEFSLIGDVHVPTDYELISVHVIEEHAEATYEDFGTIFAASIIEDLHECDEIRELLPVTIGTV